jgi:uncharacterized protein (TIGR01777 family)
MKETVLITGGTGLVGRALTTLLLERGYQVTVFTRSKKTSQQAGLRYAQWDPARKKLDITALQSADHIIHLAGANVADRRWTAGRKQEIADSRTGTADLLFESLRDHPNKVKKVISASATGYYGEYTGKLFTETDPPAHDFLGVTCKAWEDSVRQMESLGKSVLILRSGIVLSLEGGALREFRKPARFGFATIMGNGEQFVSWIHLQDLVRLYYTALLNDQLHGVYNAVAPHPVTNLQLVQSLARAMKGRSFITVHVPAFALKLALGEMSTEVLKSVKVSSEKIQQTGFVFSYPDVDSAVEQLVSNS